MSLRLLLSTSVLISSDGAAPVRLYYPAAAAGSDRGFGDFRRRIDQQLLGEPDDRAVRAANMSMMNSIW
jgi:hypothetical protein